MSPRPRVVAPSARRLRKGCEPRRLGVGGEDDDSTADRRRRHDVARLDVSASSRRWRGRLGGLLLRRGGLSAPRFPDCITPCTLDKADISGSAFFARGVMPRSAARSVAEGPRRLGARVPRRGAERRQVRRSAGGPASGAGPGSHLRGVGSLRRVASILVCSAPLLFATALAGGRGARLLFGGVFVSFGAGGLSLLRLGLALGAIRRSPSRRPRSVRG